MYFNIKCIGKLPGPTNEFERSLVFEKGEFDCRCKNDATPSIVSVTMRYKIDDVMKFKLATI